jgi:transcriptional regulator with XRE-family HTH domain
MKKYPEFGPVLRRLRLERKLSQEALAERVGMAAHSHLSRLESGHAQPTIEMVFRLAEALEIEAWEIVKAMKEGVGKNPA